MRYVLIDRIHSLEPGRALTGVKNVSMTDALLTQYGHGVWALPAAMLLESMAQAAGILVASTIDFRAQPVLAKVQPFSVSRLATPGDQITVSAELRELREMGCQADAIARIGGAVVAEASIFLGLAPLEEPRRIRLRAHLARTFPGWFGAPAALEVHS
jgi:UDP-3-O-[3-hydroxymyristoyl] N-acetylglucosamine deacetylase / 3-hydroxyacyl-[acyl-carrier-protein] dehydratase